MTTHDTAIHITQIGAGLRVVGELDVATAPVLAAALDPLPAGSGDVVLDLCGVDFIDSSALGVLVRVQRVAAAGGRRVRITNPTVAVQRLLELTALDAMFGLGGHEGPGARDGDGGDR